MRWPWFPDSLVAAIALLVTIFLGLLTILEKAWAIGVGLYRQLRSWSHLPLDRKVFQFLKSNNHGRLYDVKEISAALGKKPRPVAESLLRLAEKNKAHAVEDRLWGLHDFEA
jgi:hypothetical protein